MDLKFSAFWLCILKTLQTFFKKRCWKKILNVKRMNEDFWHLENIEIGDKDIWHCQALTVLICLSSKSPYPVSAVLSWRLLPNSCIFTTPVSLSCWGDLTAYAVLTLTRLPICPAHFWQLLVLSHAPITSSTPICFCQSISRYSSDLCLHHTVESRGPEAIWL